MEDKNLNFLSERKSQLLTMKRDLLNRHREVKFFLTQNDTSRGDEADQSAAQVDEYRHLSETQRMQQLLVEIEFALARIESGQYGVCEETEEPIEPERLVLMPHTRVSIEGAELREARRKAR